MRAEQILQVLDLARESYASDIIFSPGNPPFVRVGGVYRYLREFPLLGIDEVWEVVERFLPEWAYKNARTRAQGQKTPEDIQVSYTGTIARYRVQVAWVLASKESGEDVIAPMVTLRLIPRAPWPFRDLGLPDGLLEFTRYDVGLVLVAGPTDSGKTTTLASLVDHINGTETKHVLTVERPIEYVHSSRRSVIHQREVGRHVVSVPQAVHTALRSNVDVIVVGEARSGEEYRAVLEAAETGHLVLASMHAPGVVEAIERFVHATPQEDQALVRQVLANVLLGVVVQRLLPTGSPWRSLAYEFLAVDSRAREAIKKGEYEKLYSIMESRQADMRTLEQSVAELVRMEKVPLEVARFYVNREERLFYYLSGKRP